LADGRCPKTAQEINAITEQKKVTWATIDKRLIVVLLIVFVQFVGAAMVLPILPLYAKNRFAMSFETITLLNTAFFAAQFLAGPYIGRLSDRYGRVPVLFVSQLGTALSFLMIALAQSPEMLLVARLLDGITGGNIIVARAYITDITPPEQRTQALGYIAAALGTGFIFGPAIGGIASGLFTYEAPFFLAALVAFGLAFLTWRMLDETVSAEERENNRKRKTSSLSPRRILANGPLLSVLLIVLGAQFAFAMLQNTFALYGEAVIFADTPETVEIGVGLLLAVVGVGQIMTQVFLVRRFVRWFGEPKMVVIGNVFRLVALILLIFAPNVVFASLALLVLAVGGGTQQPALQTMSIATVDPSERGAVLGVYQSAFSLAIIFGSAIAGTLFAIAPQVPFAVGAAALALMIVPSVMLMRWSQRQPDVAVG
jgi:MFS transporter, DHA1 family, tetracycline resistance protein